MTDIVDYVDDLRVEVPEPTDFTLERAVRYSIQEFLRQSECWRTELSITVLADTYDYRLILPSDTYALASDYCYFIKPDGSRVQLKSKRKDQVDGHVAQYNSAPVMFATTDTELSIEPSGEDGTAILSVKLGAKSTIFSIPDRIGEKWFEAIRAGALARLLAMPDKQWTNMNSALSYDTVFNNGVKEARRDARRDRSRPERVVKYVEPW